MKIKNLYLIIAFHLLVFTACAQEKTPEVAPAETLIEYMKSKDKTLQIYWDDFKLWKDKRP